MLLDITLIRRTKNEMATTRQIDLLRLINIAVLFFCVQAKSPTCAFGPNNEAPETLTCTFEIDLRHEKHGFTVQLYCPHNGKDPVLLLSCEWRKDPGPNCTLHSPGYTFNASTVSNKIVLGIDCLTGDIEGNYTCQLLPPLNGVQDKAMCPYTHRDVPKKTSCGMEPSEKTPEMLSCTFGVDLGQTKHGFNVHRYGFKENEDPAIVLSCIWTKGVPGPRCYVAPDVTFDNSTISTNIVLHNVTMEGNYTCQLIPRVCEDNIQKLCNIVTVKAMCVFEPNTEKPEKLTCTCGGDAEQRKHNFSVFVIRYGKNPAVVLSCNWKEDQTTCNDYESEGFTFDKSIVSSRIVLGIKTLTKIDLEGVYRCHVILPLGEDDNNQMCSNKLDVAGVSGSGSGSGSDSDSGLGGSAIAGIVIGVLAGVVLLGAGAYLVRRYKCRGVTGPTGSPQVTHTTGQQQETHTTGQQQETHNTAQPQETKTTGLPLAAMSSNDRVRVENAAQPLLGSDSAEEEQTL